MTVLCGCVYVCRIQHGEVLHGVNFSSNFWRFSSMAARFRDLTKCYILMWHFCLRAYLQSFAHTHTQFQIAGCLDMSDCEKLYQSLFPTELFLLFRFVQEDIGLIMINLWLFLLSNPLPSCWYPALQISKKSVHRLCLFFMLKKHVPFNMGDQKAGISTLERGVMQLMRHAADHV